MLFCNTAGPHRSGIMAASRSVICRQLIILMCRPVTPEDDILRSFRKKLRMTSVIRKLMIFFDYGLVHEVDVLIISLDPASEPVHYLVRIVKQIFRLAFVTCPYLRTGALTVPGSLQRIHIGHSILYHRDSCNVQCSKSLRHKLSCHAR